MQYSAKKVVKPAGSRLTEEPPSSRKRPTLVSCGDGSRSQPLTAWASCAFCSGLPESCVCFSWPPLLPLKPFGGNGLCKQNLEILYVSDEEIHGRRPFFSYEVDFHIPTIISLLSKNFLCFPFVCTHIRDLLPQVFWNSPFSDTPTGP